MWTAEERALRTIEKGTTAWEKTKEKLSKAKEVLMEIISKKAEKIEKLEFESNVLMDQVRKTENFINNTDKLYSNLEN